MRLEPRRQLWGDNATSQLGAQNTFAKASGHCGVYFDLVKAQVRATRHWTRGALTTVKSLTRSWPTATKKFVATGTRTKYERHDIKTPAQTSTCRRPSSSWPMATADPTSTRFSIKQVRHDIMVLAYPSLGGSTLGDSPVATANAIWTQPRGEQRAARPCVADCVPAR